jgi:cytoskeletal protein RodZ
MLKKFTEELKAKREEAGITLQNVAAKTRIDIKFLEALEEGNFNFLPDLYVKAFIKQYAKVVGLDEDETVQKYILAKEGKQETVNEEKPAKTKPEEETEVDNVVDKSVESEKSVKSFVDGNENKKENVRDKKKEKQLLIGGSAIGGFVLLLLVYFLFINNGDDIIVEEKPYEEVLQEAPERFIEEKKEEVTENNSPALTEDLTLTITNVDSTDSSWVFVIMDDKSSEDFLLLPNISKTVKANNNFVFTLGNSGVVKLIFNNKTLEFEGSRGVVRYFKLDVNGLERIYKPPQLSQE